MNRKGVPILVGIGLVVLLNVFLVLSLAPHPAYAVEYWEDTITLYPSSTSILAGIREIQNTEVNHLLNVKVQYYYSNNITLFKKYYLTGNGTTFTAIENGTVTKVEDTKQLSPNQKLLFDIEASPRDTVSVGETASVTVQIIRLAIPIVPPPPPTIPPPPKKFTLLLQVFDLFNMKAPNLNITITDQITAQVVAQLTTDAEGMTPPVLLKAGTYVIDIYYQSKLQYSQTIILKGDTTLRVQIGIPIVITFTQIILICLAILTVIAVLVLIARKRRGD